MGELPSNHRIDIRVEPIATILRKVAPVLFKHAFTWAVRIAPFAGDLQRMSSYPDDTRVSFPVAASLDPGDRTQRGYDLTVSSHKSRFLAEGVYEVLLKAELLHGKGPYMRTKRQALPVHRIEYSIRGKNDDPEDLGHFRGNIYFLFDQGVLPFSMVQLAFDREQFDLANSSAHLNPAITSSNQVVDYIETLALAIERFLPTNALQPVNSNP